jgi:hypothetical protein
MCEIFYKIPGKKFQLILPGYSRWFVTWNVMGPPSTLPVKKLFQQNHPYNSDVDEVDILLENKIPQNSK